MSARKANLPIVLLSGGVGGAIMARGFTAVLDPPDLTVVVNVGDDDAMYGVNVSPDLDTVIYTLAGVEGPHGWGRRDDTFAVMEGLSRLGVDTTFRLGDQDLATCLERTNHLTAGGSLSSFTTRMAAAMGVDITVLPATDDELRTKVKTGEGEWLAFQDYFVLRHYRDKVHELRFAGADVSRPAPGVIDAIAAAAGVVVTPSNPPLSVWPTLAVPAIREAVAAKPIVVAVSPLFGGQALKGPAASVMSDLGLPPGNAGVLAAYEGIVTHLVVDAGDAGDAARLSSPAITVSAFDTRIGDTSAGARLGTEILRIIGEACLTVSVR